jgi:uncharacterized protein YegJ (DUF2314 family)
MSEKIYINKNDEPMKVAKIKAIETFKYFWRELSWESRRIIPGLDLYAIKVPIKTNAIEKDIPGYEHMWFNQVQYDGICLSGELMNEPRWVEFISIGERINFKLEDITDWMYVIQGRVYGAFSVNVIREKMSPPELEQHDCAWGLNFGDPKNVIIAPLADHSRNRLPEILNEKSGYIEGDDIPEHPMSINMAENYEQAILENPQAFLGKNNLGSSMLHFEALAGNLAQTKILLKHGADRDMKDRNGNTPSQLAQILKWNNIVEVLK